MEPRKLRRYTRLHVVGVMAIVISLGMSTTALGADEAERATVSVKKFKALKKRVKALEKIVNAPVTGDVTGTLPNLQIAPAAVGTDKLADNAVTTPKVADDAVSTAKIADNAVGTTEIADNAVNAAKIAANAVGSSEIAGDAVGAAELDDISFRSGSTTSVANNDTSAVSGAACNAGEQVLGGGGLWGNLNNEGLAMQSSFFFGSWIGVGANTSGASVNWTPLAICLAP